MAKNFKHFTRRAATIVAVVAGAMVLMATHPRDFYLGRHIEVLINMMRELSVMYVDPIELVARPLHDLYVRKGGARVRDVDHGQVWRRGIVDSPKG